MRKEVTLLLVVKKVILLLFRRWLFCCEDGDLAVGFEDEGDIAFSSEEGDGFTSGDEEGGDLIVGCKEGGFAVMRKEVIFDSHKTCEYVMISVRLAGLLSVCTSSDTINMIQIKLCMKVVLIEKVVLIYRFQWPWLYFKVTAVMILLLFRRLLFCCKDGDLAVGF